MKKNKEELYASTDIEANGRVPGLHSMLSFATACFDINKQLLGTFSANLELMEGTTSHPETNKFWNESEQNKAAYAATRVDLEHPRDAMHRYSEWLKSFSGYTPMFVGYPAAFDFKWIDYYSHYYLDENPFGFSRCIDVKSFAYARLEHQTNFQRTTKRNMPNRWFDDLPHTHIALDDAIEQGAMWINLLREAKGLDRVADHTPTVVV